MRSIARWRSGTGGIFGRLLTLGTALGLLSAASPAVAAVDSVEFSPDITVELSGTTLDDADVAEDDLAGTVTPFDLRQLAPGADVNAYTVTSNGDMLLSFDTTTTPAGGPTAGPGDVVRFDGFNYTMEFEGSANGVPNGASVDALSVSGSDLLLSFDVTVALGAVTAEDEDLVRFDGSSFQLFFDGSVAGVPAELDLDAADLLDASGTLVASFDGSGTVGGVRFDDEDMLEFDSVGGTWQLAYDGSAQHAGWTPGDLDAVFAVPEPALISLQLVAIGSVAFLARRRSSA